MEITYFFLETMAVWIHEYEVPKSANSIWGTHKEISFLLFGKSLLADYDHDGGIWNYICISGFFKIYFTFENKGNSKKHVIKKGQP